MQTNPRDELGQQAVQDAPGTFFARILQHLEFEPHAVALSKYSSVPSELQKRGVAFMIHRETHSCHAQFGGLICDELGLGKTFQTLMTIVERLRTDPDELQKTLVVASSVVLYEWERQIAAHIKPGVLRVALYYGAARSIPDWNSFDILLTTYGTVRTEYFRDRVLVNGSFAHWARRLPDGQRIPSVFGRLFYRVVLDEGHAIRNTASQQHEAACELNGEVKWCISATPVWNSVDDLYAIFKFLGAHPLNVRHTFQEFVSSRMFYDPQAAISYVRNFIQPIEIRRSKDELDLPPLTELTIAVELSESERLFYEALKSFSQDTVQRLFRTESWLRTTGWARAHTMLGQRARQCILSVILRMRQTCVHPQMAIDACKTWVGQPVPAPRLVESAAHRLQRLLEARRGDAIEEECIVCFTDPPTNCLIPCGHTFCGTCSETLMALSADAKCPMCREPILDHKAVEAALRGGDDEGDEDMQIGLEPEWDPMSSKMRAMMDDLQRRRSQDPTTKVLIFSQWRTPLDCVEKILHAANIRFLRVDGSVTAKLRSARQRTFNDDAGIGAMLCSLNCCSEGINLQGANVVYILDLWWTDAREKQAGNRAHRVGQTRPVEIVHLIAKDTIEERILDMQKRKRSVADAANGTRNLDNSLWQDRVRRLMELHE